MKKSPLRTLAVGGAVVAVALSGLHAQKTPPADAAAQLTGTWTLNRDLSPGFRGPGGRPGGPGRGAAMFARSPSVPQRGGGRGGDAPTDASDRSPAEIAAQAAMRQLQQLAEEIKIDATSERVTFTDARGERTYTVDGKSTKIVVGGAEVSTKSRWDKTVLKQEFSTAESKLAQSWNVDGNGRLVLVAKLESLRLTTPDQKAVFDRKQTP